MAKLLTRACLLGAMLVTSVSVMPDPRLAAQSPPAVLHRDIVFVRGIDSVGTCDQAEKWVEQYFGPPVGKGLFSFLEIGSYLHFNYGDGGSYDCPRSEPAYTALDTCDGVAKAAEELKQLVGGAAGSKVTIVAHSMGGLASAYLVASDEAWARDHIASVVAFDSPLKGLTPPLQLGQLLVSICGRDVTVYDDSISQMSADSAIVATATRAGGVVPFYTLDATRVDTSLLDIEFVPRDRMTIDGVRAFRRAAACDRPGADSDNCQPPAPADDDHETVWNCRFDGATGTACPSDGLDKAFLVGCAAAAAVDCSLLRTGIFAGESRQQSVEVTPEAEQLRLSLSSDDPIRTSLTSPDGTVYEPDRTSGSVAHASEPGFHLYEIQDPAPGRWTVELAAGDLPTEGVDVAIAVVSTEVVTESTQGTATARPPVEDGSGTTGVRLVSVVAGSAAVGAVVLVSALWWARRRRGRP